MNVFGPLASQPLAQRLRYLKRVRGEILAFQERMADLRSAARDAAQFEALSAALSGSGFEDVNGGLLHYGPEQHLMGWTLVARKPG